VGAHRIVPARPGDAAALRQLELDCFTAVDVFSVRQFRRLLASPTCRILVVRGAGGTLVAEIVGLLRHFSIPSGRIYKVAVHPSAQGQGLGRRLIAAMEAEFRRAGMVAAVAEVRVSNTGSRALFEACGYQAGERLPRYYADGEDGVKYRKVLASRPS
jgi:ribosomal-protein-alanine N-acetyltransferase